MTRDQAAADMVTKIIDLKCEAIDWVMSKCQEPGIAERLKERFLKAGEKYGEYNPEMIDTELELEQEFLDILSYLYLAKGKR